MRIHVLSAVLLCAACSTESPQGLRGQGIPSAVCTAGASEACACASGASGMRSCAAGGTWEPCVCTMVPNDIDVGNPTEPTPQIDAGPPPSERPMGDCSPGLYLGTYDCELTLFGLPVPLTGDVSFNLSINETTVDRMCDPSDEFCSDLVISENGGTLFGFGGGFYGFETMLQGALDCSTGEFRAMGIAGRWGVAISKDPNDPNAFWTVEDPPLGMFDGELMGTHSSSGTETISGMWNLDDSVNALNCAGPFTVTLQP